MYSSFQFDILQHLDGLVVIPQQGVQMQKPREAEVDKHLVEVMSPVLYSHILRVTSTSVHLQLPIDVGLVYQRVKDIEDTVNVPDFEIRMKEVNLFLQLLGSLTVVLTK